MSHVSLSGIEFRYPGKGKSLAILRDFDLEIAPGEFVVMIGPSGCGKTTVLNLVAGFEFPSQGRVIVEGAEVRKPGADRAVIFQGDDSLLPWLTALENIELGPRIAGMARGERRKLAIEHLKLIGLEGQGHKRPSELSGGMKQRIQLARAMVCASRILLMDEPFGAIDALTRAALQDELAALWERTHPTVLFITHDITEAILLADRICVMTPGPDATIAEMIPVTLARPRDRSLPEFGTMYGRVHAALSKSHGQDARAASARP
ncbi:MAG TPA: ABC transporter ATP-binding protein [Magnetospirillaceae bacterium]|jgi:NitT/TauT family transport system ATP-binding protein